jgi:hypothetical protein
VDWLQFVGVGANLGALGVVLMLLASGKLVAGSWAKALVEQANRNAADARAAAIAADTRADLLQTAMVEQTAAIRAMESALRSVTMGWPQTDRAQSGTWHPQPQARTDGPSERHPM